MRPFQIQFTNLIDVMEAIKQINYPIVRVCFHQSSPDNARCLYYDFLDPNSRGLRRESATDLSCHGDISPDLLYTSHYL